MKKLVLISELMAAVSFGGESVKNGGLSLKTNTTSRKSRVMERFFVPATGFSTASERVVGRTSEHALSKAIVDSASNEVLVRLSLATSVAFENDEQRTSELGRPRQSRVCTDGRSTVIHDAT